MQNWPFFLMLFFFHSLFALVSSDIDAYPEYYYDYK